VRLIDDDQFGRGAQETIPAALIFDIIDTDNREREMFPDAHIAARQATFKRSGGTGAHHRGFERKLMLQLTLPLIAQMGRADHRHPRDLTAVEQFTGDQRRLNRLPDPHIIGDQQAHRVETQRHQQRHNLIGARAKPQPPHTAERTGAAAQAQARRIAQQRPTLEIPHRSRVGRRKRRRAHIVLFERQEDAAHPGCAPAERTQQQQVIVLRGKHHPFAFATAHQ
jgi:hypothetical protein